MDPGLVLQSGGLGCSAFGPRPRRPPSICLSTSTRNGFQAFCAAFSRLSGSGCGLKLSWIRFALVRARNYELLLAAVDWYNARHSVGSREEGMAKRSPRYPRHNLGKAIDMTRKLFHGAHQSRVDVDAAAKVIGYASSTGGAAASAIGALRQFGLVDGLRGDIGVSDLAMRILQPLNESEYREAVSEAARKPEIFGRVFGHFNEMLPGSDEPLRAFLIRHEGFSTAGANELIAALRETVASLPQDKASSPEPAETAIGAEVSEIASREVPPEPAHSRVANGGGDELIILPLGASCRAELRFVGEANSTAFNRLIRHLELMRDILVEDQPSAGD